MHWLPLRKTSWDTKTALQSISKMCTKPHRGVWCWDGVVSPCWISLWRAASAFSDPTWFCPESLWQLCLQEHISVQSRSEVLVTAKAALSSTDTISYLYIFGHSIELFSVNGLTDNISFMKVLRLPGLKQYMKRKKWLTYAILEM